MPGHFTFFADKIENQIAYFSEQDAKHATLVLRFSVGDKIEFTNGMGEYGFGKILEANKKGMIASLEKCETHEKNEFTLAIGILKSSERMEWLVEKCTEIGVGKLIFFKSQNGERGRINTDKLKKIAIAALKQSHGAWLPEIIETTFENALQISKGQRYLAYCDEHMATKIPLPFESDATVFIGPEGDFTQGEVELSKSYNVQTIGLGRKILRTETAAVVCASWSIT